MNQNARELRFERAHRLLLILLYGLTLAALIWIVVAGGDYYSTPVAERAHHPDHPLWKPGGLIGHGLGVVGALLMLTLLLYIARKQLRFMREWGNIRHWLNIHIWMGISAPLLVTFHSSFKVQGIVAISYWSMVAVALSGFLGRYIYLQIPRSLSGGELSERELQKMDEELFAEMKQQGELDDEQLRRLQRDIGGHKERQRRGLAAVFAWFFDDLAAPLRRWRSAAGLRRRSSLTREQIRRLISSARRRRLLLRRRAFLRTARSLLHYWHVVHRPFAAVMFIILAVHIGVAVLFGYTWLF